MVLGLCGYVFIVMPNQTPEYAIEEGDKTTEYDYSAGVAIIPGESREALYNEITGDYRPIYDGMTEEQYEQFFGNLPSFPKDFFQIAQLIYDGKITDYSRVSEKYWMQPEFYPSWFASVNDSYIFKDTTRNKLEGYGCYPGIKEISAKKGATIVVNTYFKTGYGVEAYQGLIVRPYLPSSALDLRGNELFEQNEDASDYLRSSIINEDDKIYQQFKDNLAFDNVGKDDWMVILKPTFQFMRDKITGEITGAIGFPSDWVTLLELEVDISEDTPSGYYVVALELDTPCRDINQEYYLSVEHEYYGAMYYPAGHVMKNRIPHFQLIILVE